MTIQNKRGLLVGVLGTVVVVAVFAFYISQHLSLLSRLATLPPLGALLLLGLYVLWFGATAMTMQACLRLCVTSLPIGENLLLNAYSTLTNFFIPGQGGIALRGLYLKRRTKLPIRRFVLSTLLYYLCYAMVAATMLLAPALPWWQTAGGVAVVGLLGTGVVRWYAVRSRGKEAALLLDPGTIAMLVGATLAQALVQIAIFTVELRLVDAHLTLGQAISYTGAANFALFAALTPGAIGIRESFLLFSQQLHHIATTTIVAASIIDRAVFLVFLGLLFGGTLAFHAKRRLHITRTGTP